MTCVVCWRREPASGLVCNSCLLTIDAKLEDLPRKMCGLPLMLIPGQSPGGERVATTRVGSPTSARLDALSLRGPGSVAVMDSDQAGVLPPAEWLDLWVRRWRAVFGHHQPRPVTARRRQRPVRDPGEVLRWAMQARTAQDVTALLMAQELRHRWRQGVAELVAGHEPGYSGARPASLREDDPVGDAWQIRFGEPAVSDTAAANVVYLRSWLNVAAERDDLDLAGFAAELRKLSAELTRVLGEQPDKQWLGRCPTQITDKTSGERSVCGADLRQDPHASVVECPRCHSTWGPRKIHLIHLAADIRRVWPLDRRRRYHADEIDALRDVPCPACQAPVRVTWQDVTGVGDTRRWWQPTRTRCPKGCQAAGEIL